MKPKIKNIFKISSANHRKFLTNKEIIVLDEDDLDSEKKNIKEFNFKKNDELRGCIGEMTSQNQFINQ